MNVITHPVKGARKKKMLRTFITCPILLLHVYRENSFFFLVVS